MGYEGGVVGKLKNVGIYVKSIRVIIVNVITEDIV